MSTEISRPNVLFIMADQWNASCLGSERPQLRTPSLDALTGDGVKFNSAFCNNPICSPSRICFMTGQYPHTHGMLGNNNFEIPGANPQYPGRRVPPLRVPDRSHREIPHDRRVGPGGV